MNEKFEGYLNEEERRKVIKIIEQAFPKRIQPNVVGQLIITAFSLLAYCYAVSELVDRLEKEGAS